MDQPALIVIKIAENAEVFGFHFEVNFETICNLQLSVTIVPARGNDKVMRMRNRNLLRIGGFVRFVPDWHVKNLPTLMESGKYLILASSQIHCF